MDAVLQVSIYGLTLAALYLPIALGLNLIFGVMLILNFAHGEFYMLGAMLTWWLLAAFGLGFVPALLLAVLLVVLAGIAAERVLFRPLGSDIQSSLIVAIGLGLMLQTAVVVVAGADTKHYTFPLSGAINIGETNVSLEKGATTILALVAAAAFYVVLQKTKLGRAIRAVAQDPHAAMLQGIDTGVVRTVTIALGTALAAAGGALGGATFGADAFMGFEVLLYAFIIIILGGLGSMEGTLLAGLLLALLQSVVTLYFGATEAAMAAFVLLYAMLLLRPTGLFGRARRGMM